MEKIIRQVRLHKGTQMLFVTIPKDKKIKLGDYVEIISAGDSLRMRVKGEFAEQEKIFGESHGCMNFLKTDSKDVVHGEYNLRFLVMFSRCTNLCNNIEMCLKNNFPLIIRYQVANLGEIKLAVIARVKDSDEL